MCWWEFPSVMSPVLKIVRADSARILIKRHAKNNGKRKSTMDDMASRRRAGEKSVQGGAEADGAAVSCTLLSLGLPSSCGSSVSNEPMRRGGGGSRLIIIIISLDDFSTKLTRKGFAKVSAHLQVNQHKWKTSRLKRLRNYLI